MSSPVDNNLSTSPTSILVDTDATFSRREDGSQRHSPTLMRTVDDEEARERQRAMDVDSAMQLCALYNSSALSYESSCIPHSPRAEWLSQRASATSTRQRLNYGWPCSFLYL